MGVMNTSFIHAVSIENSIFEQPQKQEKSVILN